MKNVKFFDGQVTEALDYNNAQEFKADDIRNTRVDIRTAGILTNESNPSLIYISSDNRLGIFGLVAYTDDGERIVVPSNENPALPAVSDLLPDSTGKLVQVGGSALLPMQSFTMIIRRVSIMEPPLKHHVTTGETYLTVENDYYELYLRAKGQQQSGDIVLCDLSIDENSHITVDYTNTQYSVIRSEEVVGTIEGVTSASDSNYSGKISFQDHITAIGSGPVTASNPHGLSPSDLGIDIGALADHQTLLHSDGIRTDNILSTISAMYPHYHRETAVVNSNEVVYVEPLSTSLREVAVINGTSVLPKDFPTTFEYSFYGKGESAYIGYYIISYDVTAKQCVVNGPYTSEKSTDFVGILNTETLFPICSFKFDEVSYDITGDNVNDIENNYDIIPGSFKDRRKFNNISIENCRPDEVFALSNFAPYCNDRAYLHNARIIGKTDNPLYAVSGKQLTIIVDGDQDNPITVTFTGSNPFDADTVVTQIRSKVTTVDADGFTYMKVYARVTEEGYISLSAPFSIELVVGSGNDASSLLGFSSSYNNIMDFSDIIKELIYVGDRNGIVLFTYDNTGNVTNIDYLFGGGVRRYNRFTYSGDLITSVREGVTPL